MQEVLALDATAQAALIEKGEITPRELVEASITAAEKLNPTLNAIVTPLYEQARKLAAGELPKGPFRGVPFLLKDLFAGQAGVRMAMGSRAMLEHTPKHDAYLTRRFREAGLIVIGRSNTPEFGIVPTTEPLAFGACKNPWNPEHSTGGSSGGSAAAVAAQIVPMAHANDGGGSIRIPASCCGLFGLKPTRARTSLGPELGDVMNGLVVEHAVTRSVRDSARLLDAIMGPSPGDPYVAPRPERPFAAELDKNPGRLRIAFSTKSLLGLPIARECEEVIEETAKLCSTLEHHVSEGGPDFDGPEVQRHFLNVWAVGNASVVQFAEEQLGRPLAQNDIEPLTWAMAEMGRAVSGPQYLSSVGFLQQMARQMADYMSNFDLLLTPTLSEPPARLGYFDPNEQDPLGGIMRAAAYCPFTPLANATGQPAMSVPLFNGRSGLPIGSHFVARYGEEATLFRLAAQLERALPWAGRKPNISAV